MKIQIKNNDNSNLLEFKTEEEFQSFKLKMTEILKDTTNTKVVVFERDEETLVFPALYLKSSRISISKKDKQEILFL